MALKQAMTSYKIGHLVPFVQGARPPSEIVGAAREPPLQGLAGTPNYLGSTGFPACALNRLESLCHQVKKFIAGTARKSGSG